MLLNTSRLVVKGPKGVFTEKGGIVDPYKLCFPHYSCKDTVNDFGFVTDFKIEVTKDRYMFFSATPMKTVLPTYDEVIQVIINDNDMEFIDDDERNYFMFHDGFIYKNYIGILIQIKSSVLWLIITKNADTGDIVYTFVDKNYQQYVSDRIIVSTNIYNALYTMHSECKASINFTSSFIEHISKDTLFYPTKNDLMILYVIYKRKQLCATDLFKYNTDFSKLLKICDRFCIEKSKYSVNNIAQITTVICGNIFTMDIDYSSKVDDWMKLIGIDKLSEILEEMKIEKSYPRLKESDQLTLNDRNMRWPLADAYEKGYITFINNSSYDYKYDPKYMFVKWNSLSNYKEYEHYEEIVKIINEEESELNSLTKSLGKIGSAEAIKELKTLNKVKTIYNI